MLLRHIVSIPICHLLDLDFPKWERKLAQLVVKRQIVKCGYTELIYFLSSGYDIADLRTQNDQ